MKEEIEIIMTNKNQWLILQNQCISIIVVVCLSLMIIVSITPRGKRFLRHTGSMLFHFIGFISYTLWELLILPLLHCYYYYGVATSSALNKNNQTTSAAVTNNNKWQKMIMRTQQSLPPLRHNNWNIALNNLKSFLNESGIGSELSSNITHRLIDNISLISKVQTLCYPYSYRKNQIMTTTSINHGNIPTMEEAAKVMRFATAVYGFSMIQSVEIHYNQFIIPDYTSQILINEKEEIRRHTGLRSVDDLVIFDSTVTDTPPSNSTITENYHPLSSSFMVAIDHERKMVVVSIRGTVDISGLMTDLVSYTEEFCGGEAHAGMAQMARDIWKRLLSKETLFEIPNKYELIITGHSLGAGVAMLMTIMAYHDHLLPLPSSSKQNNNEVTIRCLAFAPPPVFYPLDAIKKDICPFITAYVHNNDIVPSLSISSIRSVFVQVGIIDEELRNNNETAFSRFEIDWNLKDIPTNVIDAVRTAHDKNQEEELIPKVVKGAPLLTIPANVIVWLSNTTNNDNNVDDDYFDLRQSLYSVEIDDDRKALTKDKQYCNNLQSVPERIKDSFMNDEEKAYEIIYCDPLKYAQSGIFFHSNMVTDHTQAAYQIALDTLQ